MATFADGESGLSVRTKINNVLQHADGTSGELVINDAGADVDFRVESDTVANALFVDGATGNVGLGTASPGFYSGKLTILGGNLAIAQGYEAIFWNAAGTGKASIQGVGTHELAFFSNVTEGMRIDASRRVLIGTTSASGANLLQVNSDATINGVRVGLGQGAILSNVAFGLSALGSVNTAVGNTAIGAYSLTNNTTGTSNTGLGRQTLYTNTTGVNNIGVGENALFYNVSGNSNIAIGASAGINLTTGHNNTIIGSIAGTAGLANTVIIGAGSTERLRIDSGGNMGLGVTPSAWAPAWKAAQVGAYGAFAAHVSVGAVRINSNAFDDGAEKYIGSTFATKYEQYEGNHRFFTAPSGTAGAAITFTNAMTLDASGNLLVGATAAAGSASNAVKMVGGVHSTVSGNIASLSTATPATMFTISGGVPSQVWMVSSDLDGEAAPSYQCVYMVTYTSSNSVTATQLVKGSLASITVSGLNVQYTQSSGGTKTNNRWSAVRIL